MTLTISTIGDEEKHEFADIWVPWLRDTMKRDVEPEDMIVMSDPAAYYASTGGTAFLAKVDEHVVGAVAVKGLGASGFEFCKLVVTESARGHGVGRALVEECLEFSARQGAEKLYLQSFNALDVALDLYNKMGFTHVAPPEEMTVLARTEVIMAKHLN